MRETLAIALLVFAAPAGAQEQKSPVQAPEPTQKIKSKPPAVARLLWCRVVVFNRKQCSRNQFGQFIADCSDTGLSPSCLQSLRHRPARS